MDLSIIIVNYKSKNKLLTCLNSIESSDLASLKYEVIVVENDSGDDLSDLNKKYLVINSEYNLGMGGGNNLGIARARGAYVLISNPDIIFKKNTIKELLVYLRSHEDVGIIAPKLLNPDLSLQYSCVRFPNFFTPILRRTFLGLFFPSYLSYYLMKSSDHLEVKDVDWLLGACLMWRNDSRLSFDERYFMYFEDVDLCRQAKQQGRQVVYYPLVEAIHDHVRSTANKPWYQALFSDRLAREHLKSALRYFMKWRKIK